MSKLLICLIAAAGVGAVSAGVYLLKKKWEELTRQVVVQNSSIIDNHSNLVNIGTDTSDLPDLSNDDTLLNNSTPVAETEGSVENDHFVDVTTDSSDTVIRLKDENNIGVSPTKTEPFPDLPQAEDSPITNLPNDKNEFPSIYDDIMYIKDQVNSFYSGFLHKVNEIQNMVTEIKESDEKKDDGVDVISLQEKHYTRLNPSILATIKEEEEPVDDKEFKTTNIVKTNIDVGENADNTVTSVKQEKNTNPKKSQVRNLNWDGDDYDYDYDSEDEYDSHCIHDKKDDDDDDDDNDSDDDGNEDVRYEEDDEEEDDGLFEYEDEADK